LVDGVLGGLQEDAFTVVDVGVPLGPRERHRRAHERHLPVQPVLRCRVLYHNQPAIPSVAIVDEKV